MNESEQFRVEVVGRQIDIPEGLRKYILSSLHQIGDKYAPRPLQAAVTFTPEGDGYRCDCTLHLDSGSSLQSTGEALDLSASVSSMLARIEKRLRRYKRRIKHHPNGAEPVSLFNQPIPAVDDGSNSAGEDAQWAGSDPAIIADAQIDPGRLTVAQAALKLEFDDLPVLLFRNNASDSVNLVYQRRDGNIGWIDLSLIKDTDKR